MCETRRSPFPNKETIVVEKPQNRRSKSDPRSISSSYFSEHSIETEGTDNYEAEIRRVRNLRISLLREIMFRILTQWHRGCEDP